MNIKFNNSESNQTTNKLQFFFFLFEKFILIF